MLAAVEDDLQVQAVPGVAREELFQIAFGFDDISGERSEGTLPRLVSQPIYRDDVINGKFAAGLAAGMVDAVVQTELDVTELSVRGIARPVRTERL